MKARIKNLFVVPALIAGLVLIPAGRVTAQTFTTLHSFTATPPPASTNSDGANPQAVLFLSGNALYGTAFNGGISGSSTLFKVNTDGTGFTTVHSFTASSNSPPYGNSDGAYPVAGLILSGNTLYGTAQNGGRSDNGTVFAVNTDGTRFTTLHGFNGSDGAGPRAGLILSGNTLYGTAENGGSAHAGTVFALHTNGTGFTTLHSFIGSTAGREGARPHAGLILSGDTLYGTANIGGSSGAGTVFAVNTDGTGFTTLYSFTARSINSSGVYANNDGANPVAGLI
jgi:uncharacterized repeat protein (TIGR03803 family)